MVHSGGVESVTDQMSSSDTARGAGENKCMHAICQRSSGPFYIASYYIKWVTTSWIYSTARFSEIGLAWSAI